MAAARAVEPAAKMAKQEDFTKTHRNDYNRFKKDSYGNGFFFPPQTIDGLEVIARVLLGYGSHFDDISMTLTLLATKECRNGLMFYKKSNMSYEMFEKVFYPNVPPMMDFGRDRDYCVCFNDLMAFMVKEVPKMQLYGNKLMTANAYTVITSALEEGEFFSTLPVVSRCGQCGDINDGTLMTVCATTEGIDEVRHRACLKCYFYNSSPEFDTDVANYMLNDHHDNYEFDILGSRKFAERYEGGLISQDMYDCDCHDEDDDDDDDDDDPPAYNVPPPVIDENAEAARAA
jgi:hypothetical protein